MPTLKRKFVTSFTRVPCQNGILLVPPNMQDKPCECSPPSSVYISTSGTSLRPPRRLRRSLCVWGRKVDKQDLRVSSTIEVGVGPWRAEEDWTNGKILTVQGTVEGPLRVAPGLPWCLLVGSSLPWRHFSATPDAV